MKWVVKLSRIVKLSKIKSKNKTKTVNLLEIAKKAAERGEFVVIDDPCYELDDLPVDIVIELKMKN